MNENKNGQAVQSKPADQPTKGNNGTVLNPKNEVMTPEKTKTPPTAKKEGEQIGGEDKGQEKNERSEEKKSPVGEQKKEMPVSFDK